MVTWHLNDLNLNLHYLKRHRESDSLLIVKFSVVIDEGDVMLVQLAISFAVLIGWHLVVCRSAPSVSHTLLAAR